MMRGASASAATGNRIRRMHHTAGLGDGNMASASASLRGFNSVRLRERKRTRNDGLENRPVEEEFPYPKTGQRDFTKSMQNHGIPKPFPKDTSTTDDGDDARGAGEINSLDDKDLRDYVRDNADQRDAMNRLEQAASGGEIPRIPSAEPWQLSIVMLLGIIGVLLGMFFHFSTDVAGHSHFIRTRKKKVYPTRRSPRSSSRKKTDEWSEDEEVSNDDNYVGDTEGVGAGGGTIAKKRMHIPASPLPKTPNDPTARLYYPINSGDNFRQREHRKRKSTQQTNKDTGVSGGSEGDSSRPGVAVQVFHSSHHTKASGGLSSSITRPDKSATISGGTNKFEMSQGVARIRTTSAMPTVPSSSPARRSVGVAAPPRPLPPALPFVEYHGLGSGLEGFEDTVAKDSENSDKSKQDVDEDEQEKTFAAWEKTPMEPIIPIPNTAPAVAGYPIVTPMGTFTPSSSFALIPLPNEGTSEKGSKKGSDEATVNPPNVSPSDVGYQKVASAKVSGEVDADCSELEQPSTPPARATVGPSDSNDFKSPFRPQPPFSKQKLFASEDSGGFSEFPTPRVDHTKGKRSGAKMSDMLIYGPELPLTSSSDVAVMSSLKNAECPLSSAELSVGHEFPGLPFMPALSSDGNPPNIFDAPRSVLLEELQLVRMESGEPGPKWRTRNELEFTTSTELPNDYQSVCPHVHQNESLSNSQLWYEVPSATATQQQQRQESENMEKLRKASTVMDPADDPRNSILHIRTNLTSSSDASSSLSSIISFSDLKLEDVIGGGGFGQVWRARWKGTPVAVKVLTGSAQSHNVPKSVLEEFIAEINMVSGMRHPNICLFMGACLDPPNRAIVTEICENGSLWDALRSVLASPYQAADGVTRAAWPDILYESHLAPPPIHGNVIRSTPVVPGGAWPWVLVKRVAAGAARGMTYLHSGNPPVLHRDLKSANILLDDSYTAKLADFGLSRLKNVRSGMTGNCGTVQWMAPEVLCNEEYAEPADVFSFGIILWEILTKECPYEGLTPIQCALSVLNGNKRPEIPAWCPQPFRSLIKNCVEKNPRDRPTFPQILAALDALP